MAKPKEPQCPHCGQPRARHPIVARTRFGVIRCDGEDGVDVPDAWITSDALETSIQVHAPNIGDRIDAHRLPVNMRPDDVDANEPRAYRGTIEKVVAYAPALGVWLVHIVDDRGHRARAGSGKPIVWAIRADYEGLTPAPWRRLLELEAGR